MQELNVRCPKSVHLDLAKRLLVLVGLRLFYSNRGELKTAREVGDQLLTLAERLDEKALLLEAHYAQGVNLFRLGELAQAREHLEHGTALYAPQEHNAHPPRAGHDHEVGYLTFACRVLLFLGYPDQAYEQSSAALRRAHELSQPLSIAFALMFAIRLHIFRHEIEAAHAQIERYLHLATTYGFGSSIPQATFFSGWLWTVRGQPEKGIAQMQKGLYDMRAAGAALDLSYVLALIAEAYGKSGQTELGLSVLNEALDQVEQIDERFYEAELYRLRGQLLLQLSPDNHTEAETCFQKALDVARSQQAKSWELRAATSLARLWQSQDKRQEAYDLLAPVYNWFQEGHDTADLIDAKALIDELS